MKSELIQEEIKTYFQYDKTLGVLIWKNHWCKSTLSRYIGTRAGNIDRDGYLIIRISEKAHKAHRLIWFLEKGTWPEVIDHINGDRLDNRIENLRASCKQNNQTNRLCHRQGKLLGASWDKNKKKWMSQIQINKKKRHLGSFKTELEAHQRYLEASVQLES